MASLKPRDPADDRALKVILWLSSRRGRMNAGGTVESLLDRIHVMAARSLKRAEGRTDA